MRGPLTALLAVLALTVPTSGTGHALEGTTSSRVVHVRLRTAVARLPVTRHSHAATYSRTLDFGDWVSQGDGCDTRAVVLEAESLAPTTHNIYCTVETGRWYSYYDAHTYVRASALQIDHTVPVENVWISGGWRWTQGTRVRYYNDLRDGRSLVAVDVHDNESKGDQDPSTWVPEHGSCRYARYWVAVKTRWRLSVTPAEKESLTGLAGRCANRMLTVTRAVVQYR
jgi:hypothetical protein